MKSINLEHILKTTKEKMPYLKRVFKVKRIGVFGSYALGNASEESDIDFIVEFDGAIGIKFMELYDFFENLFLKKIDIITPEGLKNIRTMKVREEILQSVKYV